MPKDFDLENHGSIFILTPETKAAADWCDEHLPEDAMGWGKCGYVIEPRYVNDIVEGIQNDGLEVV